MGSPLALPMRAVATVLILLVAGFALGEAAPAPADDKPQPISIADVKSPGIVDFGNDVLPIFRSSCLACHNAKEAKADLVLETPAAIRKGGESGPAVLPGKSAHSLLLLAASHQGKPFMPPRNNK